eukprot:COSAG02_NODE_1824_length_10760_cov_8.583154_12_plen_68_part_00
MQLVADHDREYAEVAEQDRARVPTHDELEPAVAVDSTLPASSEPTEEEMRQARLQQFGLASSGDEPI